MKKIKVSLLLTSFLAFGFIYGNGKTLNHIFSARYEYMIVSNGYSSRF